MQASLSEVPASSPPADGRLRAMYAAVDAAPAAPAASCSTEAGSSPSSTSVSSSAPSSCGPPPPSSPPPSPPSPPLVSQERKEEGSIAEEGSISEEPISAYLENFQELAADIFSDPSFANLPFSPVLKHFLRSASPSPSSPPRDTSLASAMLLYSRLLSRKGPWFRADDTVTLRYYTNDFSFHPVHYPEPPLSLFPPLTALMNDLSTLRALGLVRSPSSETEHGLLAGNPKAEGGIFTAAERKKVLTHLGLNKGTKDMQSTRNRILDTMKNQKTLSFSKPSASSSSSLIPISSFLLSLVRDSLLSSCSRLPPLHSKSSLSPLLPPSPLLLFRLAESPLHSLRRNLRAYLVCSAGAGQMREAPWISVFQARLRASTGEPSPRDFGEGWNKVVM